MGSKKKIKAGIEHENRDARRDRDEAAQVRRTAGATAARLGTNPASKAGWVDGPDSQSANREPAVKVSPSFKEGSGPKVMDVVRLHMVTDDRGWIHSHGLGGFGLPELEIVGCPLYLCKGAMGLLNHIAQYMLDGGVVKAGERMGLGGPIAIQFIEPIPLEGEEGHYEYPVLRITDAPMHNDCDHCRAKAVGP